MLWVFAAFRAQFRRCFGSAAWLFIIAPDRNGRAQVKAQPMDIKQPGALRDG
jgi:hypothetical protein